MAIAVSELYVEFIMVQSLALHPLETWLCCHGSAVMGLLTWLCCVIGLQAYLCSGCSYPVYHQPGQRPVKVQYYGD
jgi:hypothetical protein